MLLPMTWDAVGCTGRGRQIDFDRFSLRLSSGRGEVVTFADFSYVAVANALAEQNALKTEPLRHCLQTLSPKIAEPGQ